MCVNVCVSVCMCVCVCNRELHVQISFSAHRQHQLLVACTINVRVPFHRELTTSLIWAPLECKQLVASGITLHIHVHAQMRTMYNKHCNFVIEKKVKKREKKLSYLYMAADYRIVNPATSIT